MKFGLNAIGFRGGIYSFVICFLGCSLYCKRIFELSQIAQSVLCQLGELNVCINVKKRSSNSRLLILKLFYCVPNIIDGGSTAAYKKDANFLINLSSKSMCLSILKHKISKSIIDLHYWNEGNKYDSAKDIICNSQLTESFLA